MKTITIDDFNTTFPCIEKEDINSLDPQNQKLFLDLWSKSYSFLTDYINKKVGLNKYDKEMDIFDKVSSEEKDIYQSLAEEKGLSYIYVRNNVHVERLSSEEIEVLNNNNEYNEEIEKLIESTYQRLIVEKHGEPGTIINFGPPSPEYLIPNNVLIVGIRYDLKKQDEDGEEKKDLETKYNDVRYNLAKSLNENLEFPTYVIQYDEFSVKPLKKNPSNLTR